MASPLERLFAHRVVQPGPLDTPCWLSTYRPLRDGYTQMKVDGRMVLCHRFAYETYVGQIASGLQLDHLCVVRSCFNPEHLEPVTALANTQRSNAPSTVTRRTGTCKRGHSMADAYTHGGQLHCRQCRHLRHAMRVRSPA